MRESNFASKPALTLPFDAAGRAGVVRVWYAPNRRSTDGGFSALSGWERETRAGVGFPAIRCDVTSQVPGYWNFMGWLQYVTQDPLNGKPVVRIVDRVPALVDRDLPFAIIGYAPTFYDAPAHNRLPVIDWRARLFLCTMPIMGRAEPIVPLVGLKWGYRIEATGELPQPYPLTLASTGDWRETRLEVHRRHRAWSLATRPPKVRSPAD